MHELMSSRCLLLHQGWHYSVSDGQALEVTEPCGEPAQPFLNRGPGEISPEECHRCHGPPARCPRGMQVYFGRSLWKQRRNGQRESKAFSDWLRGVVGTEDPGESASRIRGLLLLPSRPVRGQAAPAALPEAEARAAPLAARWRSPPAGAAASARWRPAGARGWCGPARPWPAPLNSPGKALFVFTQVCRILTNKGECPEISRQRFLAGAAFPPASRRACCRARLPRVKPHGLVAWGAPAAAGRARSWNYRG